MKTLKYKHGKDRRSKCDIITKDGHTMFHQDIAYDLNHYYEKCKELVVENSNLKKRCTELYEKSTKVIGWKGHDELTVEKQNDDIYLVTEHRKQKESGDVNKTTHKIKVTDVDNLFSEITLLTVDKEKTNYTEIIKNIMLMNDIDIDISAFNGGQNRGLYYFPLYYYPMKILEKKGFVNYKHHSKISLVRKNKELYQYRGEFDDKK